MSIADKITRLQTAKTNIASAITNKGGTVQSGDGFEDFATDIATIPSGITPSGNINITTTAQTDVTNYATAQVVDADLVASNIKKDVDILGVVGSYEGGSSADSWIEYTLNSSKQMTSAYCHGTIVPKDVLRQRTTITSIRLDSTIERLEQACFGWMTNLASVVSDSNFAGLTYLGAQVFYGSKLTSVNFPDVVLDSSAHQCFYSCTLLASATFPKGVYVPAMFFQGCTALETAQFGSIGYPVTYVQNNVFSNCTQSELTITMYVDATTLADIPANVTQYAPWGATNATIVYRNSTTGEVIAE